MNETQNRGLLIAFDGIDGTGKTTHSSLLADWLIEQGREVVQSKEPTDGQWGRMLRGSGSTGRLSAEEELDLFLKDRAQHVEELIKPALNAGKVVILDRYYFSTMAYQGARGFAPEKIRELNEKFAPIPDLLFIPDLEVDEALARISARGDIANEFEKRENLERCREIFMTLKGEPFVHVVDTNRTPDEVQEELRALVGI